MNTITKQQYPNWLNTIIRPVDLRTADQPNRRWVCDSTTGKPLSRVSDRYCLIQNADLVRPLVDQFGVNSIKKTVQWGGGQYLYMAILTGRSFNISGDVIDEMITFTNSYNKTRAYSFWIGAWRKVCSNGLHAFRATFCTRKIHVGVIPVKEMVADVLNNYSKNSFDFWRDWASKPMTMEEELELVKNFNAFDPGDDAEPNLIARQQNSWVKHRASQYIMKAEDLDNQRNAWGLYNQINRSIGTWFPSNSAFGKVLTANRNLEEYMVKVVSK